MRQVGRDGKNQDEADNLQGDHDWAGAAFRGKCQDGF